jgi:hypothetical protein
VNGLTPIFQRELERCCASESAGTCKACVDYALLLEKQVKALVAIITNYISSIEKYIQNLEKNEGASVSKCPARPSGRGKFRHSTREEIDELATDPALETILGGGRRVFSESGEGKASSRTDAAPLLVTMMDWNKNAVSSADVVYVDPKRKRKDHLITIALATGVLLAGGLAIGIISKRM